MLVNSPEPIFCRTHTLALFKKLPRVETYVKTCTERSLDLSSAHEFLKGPFPKRYAANSLGNPFLQTAA